MKATREHIDPGQESGFLTRRLSAGRFASVYHFHPEYEITLIETSEGRFLAGDYLGRFGPGHLALIGPNLTHWYANDAASAEPPGRSRALLIQFSRQFLGEALLRQPEMRGIDQLLRRSVRGLLFEPVGAGVRREMEACMEAGGPERVIALLRLLATLAGNGAARPLASPLHNEQAPPLASRRLDRVIEHIHTHQGERLELRELAGLAHMSPAAFSRFFHERMGLPLSRYILLKRLTEAARLLVETRYSVSEIAFAVGFNNLTHFNRQFKKWKAQTPTAFRRLLAPEAPGGE